MKKRHLLYIPLIMLLTGCNGLNGGFDPNTPISDDDPFVEDEGIDDDTTSDEELDVDVDTGDEEETIENETQSSNITDLSVAGITYDETNKLFTITAAGEFVFTGEFEGNILVNAGDTDEVKVTLNGFTIISKTDSPIKCDNAAELQVSLKKSTKNYIYDYRETKDEDNEDETQGNGAITSSCDMKISGKGSLNIVAKYNNGIHSKDDLKIKPEVYESSSIQINSYNNCLKGNDEVEIESGNLVLISTNGNGIMTESTKITDSGNQKGNVIITGGHIDIYSAKDAIDAAYNAEISKGDGDAPIINIYTSNYSEYSNEVSATSEDTLYLRTSSTLNSSYYYAVEFLKNDYTRVWKKAALVSSSQGGGYSRNVYYSVELPSNATSLKVAVFKSSVTSMCEENAYAIMSGYQTVNSYYDVAKISYSGTTISISGWTSYTTQQGGGFPGGGGMGGGGAQEEGNTEKAEVSAKGIKADNVINISDGTFFIKTYDDAIHANYGDTFDTGAVGVGDVNISGGTFEIYASDDGIHADHYLNITNGTIDIKNSYEGVEGNVINISGGHTTVYSTDDGLNAANKSGVTPAINVTGGILDVTVYGQDVDGIDSNGSFTQSGGYVITKGTGGSMSTGLDCDGTATIKGGSFVAFGRTEKTPSCSNGVASYNVSGNYSAGNHTITFGDGTQVTTTTKYSYSYVTVYSDNTTKVTIS